MLVVSSVVSVVVINYNADGGGCGECVVVVVGSAVAAHVWCAVFWCAGCDRRSMVSVLDCRWWMIGGVDDVGVGLSVSAVASGGGWIVCCSGVVDGQGRGSLGVVGFGFLGEVVRIAVVVV